MNRLRQGGNARISFFSFQDIITSVTGILILVTLMMSFSLRLDEESEERRVEMQLKAEQKKLEQIEHENALIQQRRIEASSLPSPDQTRIQVEALRREEFDLKNQRQRTENDLMMLREQIARFAPSLELRNEVATLERRIGQLRAQLADEKSKTNILFVIPDADTQRAAKKPVAVVVSAESLRVHGIEESGSGESPINSAASLRPLLQSRDPAREFIVLYFRPSGAKWFDAFRDEARRAGFEVGYDAVEEDKQIVFGTP